MGVPGKEGEAQAKGPLPRSDRTLPPGLLELSPVERGVVSIFGVASRFFVAMSSKGKLYGSVSTAAAREHPALGALALQAQEMRGGGHRIGSPPAPVPRAASVTS